MGAVNPNALHSLCSVELFSSLRTLPMVVYRHSRYHCFRDARRRLKCISTAAANCTIPWGKACTAGLTCAA